MLTIKYTRYENQQFKKYLNNRQYNRLINKYTDRFNAVYFNQNRFFFQTK